MGGRDGRAYLNTLRVDLFDHVCNDFYPSLLPLLSVFERVVQVLIAAHPKDTTILKLFRERDYVEVEEAQLTVEPGLGRVGGRATVFVCLVALLEEPASSENNM